MWPAHLSGNAPSDVCCWSCLLVCLQVSQRGGTRSFSGPTPTRPWTDACLAFRPGQRISGDCCCSQGSQSHTSQASAVSKTGSCNSSGVATAALKCPAEGVCLQHMQGSTAAEVYGAKQTATFSMCVMADRLTVRCVMAWYVCVCVLCRPPVLWLL